MTSQSEANSWYILLIIKNVFNYYELVVIWFYNKKWNHLLGKKALENESTSLFFLSHKIWAVITNQNFRKEKIFHWWTLCLPDRILICQFANDYKKWNTIIAWCSFFVCEIACFEAKWWFISDSFFSLIVFKILKKYVTHEKKLDDLIFFL